MKRLLLRLLLVLLMALPCWAVNDFSGDANAVALYNCEPGALGTDSKGSTDLTVRFIGSNDTLFKQGLGSASNTGSPYQLWIADADLPSGFPGKSGEANNTFSICARSPCGNRNKQLVVA